MLPAPGALNIYVASVPGLFVTKDLEYYLESYDTQLRSAAVGSAKAPFRVAVVDPVVPPSQVVVRSDPPEATLRIDGKEVGLTPWLGLLTPGPHELVLRKEGFQETTSSLDVPEGRDLDTTRVLPQAAEQATFAVTSEPSGATVSIDGQLLGQTPIIAPSPDGPHTLTVEKQGFARAERTLSFAKDRSLETSFTLTKLPPEPALAITSDPAGAKVFVDGKELGKTPFIGVVPAGEHLLELKLEGRRSAQAQIMMPEDRDLDLRFSLEKADVQRTPVLAVSVDPAGAEVFVDDAAAGPAPYLGEVKPGKHKIKVAAKGFVTYEKQVTMPDGNDLELTLALVPVPPPPGPSQVSISTEPPGVELVIDGKPAGTSPVTVALPAGDHVVGAGKDGLRSTEERFRVVQGQGMQLKLALQAAEKGQTAPVVSVKTDPDGAQVLVDGKASGTTPVTVPLTPGKHRLSVQKDGFKTRDEPFELPADKAFELRFSVTLEPVRKGVSLASATDVRKEAERPKQPVVDVSAVQKERRTGSTSMEICNANVKAEAEASRQVRRKALEVQRDLSTLRPGPIVLGTVGAVLVGVGALFAWTTQRQAASLGADQSTLLVPASTIVAEHDRNVLIAVGLGGAGGLLAAAGAIWGATPRKVDMGFAAEPPTKKGDAPAKAQAGSGGDEAGQATRPSFGLSPAGLFVAGAF
jgi:hypothetical protein